MRMHPSGHSFTMLRLYLVRGSFLESSNTTGGAAAGAGAGAGRRPRPVLDAKVWSKLPEELIWEVVLRLPAAQLFQLHVVSHEWCRVLTSSHFRTRLTEAAAAAAGSRDLVAAGPEHQQQRVVACMASMSSPWARGAPVLCDSNSGMAKVVDVDLTTFVPTWFWSRSESDGDQGYASAASSCSVVAAANGLVCICNNSEDRRQQRIQAPHVEEQEEEEAWEPSRPWANRYCVLNPLTRTCAVLPPMPFQPRGWLPPTAEGALTIYDNDTRELQVATFDLASSGGGGSGGREWVVTTMHSRGDYWLLTAPAVCAGGETYWYDRGRVRVVERASCHVGGGAEAEAAAADVDAPHEKVMQLQGGHLNLSDFLTGSAVFLVAHRGALYFVTRASLRNEYVDVPCGVWQLARGGKTPWTAVAQLKEQDVERLTGWRGLHNDHYHVRVRRVYCVRELLCFQLALSRRDTSKTACCHFVLGFNLETDGWELVHRETETGLNWEVSTAMELRPDLYLSHQSQEELVESSRQRGLLE